jgi:hypothetical protein
LKARLALAAILELQRTLIERAERLAPRRTATTIGGAP